MDDKPVQDFGKRKPVSVPASRRPAGPPSKRSGHVALLLMGTVAVGASRSGPASRFETRFISTSSGAFNHLRTVLRDRLVALEISRTDFFWRNHIRRTLPIMAMVITPHTPPRCG